MGEHYRTLLGHFRHELGHYYWDRLIRDDPQRLSAFRTLFGDERPDYEQALRAYYTGGAAPDWQQNHISAYATSHPWEDWAETWAHHLHIPTCAEVVHALGFPLGRLSVGPTICRGDTGGRLRRRRGCRRSGLQIRPLAGAVGLNSINAAWCATTPSSFRM